MSDGTKRPDESLLADLGPTVCAECGFPTGHDEHCGKPVVLATIHFARESSARPGSWRLPSRRNKGRFASDWDAFVAGVFQGFVGATLIGVPILVLTFWLTGWGIR